MKMIMQKFLAIILAVLMVGTPVSASNLGDFFSSKTLSNSTSGGTWTDPGTGKKYFHGGNFSFRFINTGSYTPWVSASPPKLTIGCNGLSLSGGFLALLGLDDIKLQLQNAGAAFAWGILLALKTSMPVIDRVFADIQKWARTIQSLLQDSCSAGEKLGTMWGLGNSLDGVNESLSTDYAAMKGSLESTYNKFMGIEDHVDKSTPKADSKAVAEKAKQYVEAGASVSMLASYFGKYLPEDITGARSRGTLSDVYLKRIGRGAVMTGIDSNFDKKVLMHKIVMLFFGEMAMSTVGMKDLDSLFMGSYIDKVSLKNWLKSNATGVKGVTSKGLTYLPPLITTEDLATALIYGFDKVSLDNCTGTTCKIPNYNVQYYNFETSVPVLAGVVDEDGESQAVTVPDEQTIKVKMMVMVDDQTATSSNSLSMTWNGFYQGSLDGIRTLVASKVGGTNYSWYGGVVPTNTNLNTIDVPLMLPNLNKYLEVIVKLEKKNGGETAHTENLKQILAKANAYFSALALSRGIESLVMQMIDDSKMIASEDSLSNMFKYLAHVREINKKIEMAIKDEMNSVDLLAKINKIFGDVEKEIQLKTFGNSGVN